MGSKINILLNLHFWGFFQLPSEYVFFPFSFTHSFPNRTANSPPPHPFYVSLSPVRDPPFHVELSCLFWVSPPPQPEELACLFWGFPPCAELACLSWRSHLHGELACLRGLPPPCGTKFVSSESSSRPLTSKSPLRPTRRNSLPLRAPPFPSLAGLHWDPPPHLWN
jgi:hypothetical protein